MYQVVLGRAEKVVDGINMNRSVAHLTKTLALLAILVLPAQGSMGTTCCCHSVAETSSSNAEAVSGTSGSCCQTKASDPQPCQCPCGSCCSALPDTLAIAADSLSKIVDLSSGWGKGLSALDSVKRLQSSSSQAVAAGTTSGYELCVQLCRYQI